MCICVFFFLLNFNRLLFFNYLFLFLVIYLINRIFNFLQSLIVRCIHIKRHLFRINLFNFFLFLRTFNQLFFIITCVLSFFFEKYIEKPIVVDCKQIADQEGKSMRSIMGVIFFGHLSHKRQQVKHISLFGQTR